MHFAELLHRRARLLQQARLANLAFAHARLADYAHRIERAGLRGSATLQPADPAADQFWPTLNSESAAQSVIDEHFLDEDVLELEEIVTFLQAEGFAVDETVELADLGRRLLPQLRRELLRAGVTMPGQPGPASGAASDSASAR